MDYDALRTEWASLVAQMVKNLPSMQETWVYSLSQEDPLEKEWSPTSVFLPGEFHGQRSLVSNNSPWGPKESDMTEHAHIERTQTSSNNMNTSDQTLVPKHC